MAHNTKRRVVITGLGAITAIGIGKEAFWEATSKGISGIKPIQRFSADNLPLQVAGEINNFLANDYIERKLVNRTDRMTHFVFATIQEALQDAGITLAQEDPQRVGAVIANTFGGLEYVMEQINTLFTRGPRFVSAYTAIAWLQVANVGQASIRYGIQGYCKTPLNDTAGGLDGQSSPPSEAGEADALHRAFGADIEQIPMSVPRTMIGHSYAAAGVLDTITALMALQHRTIPPTINCEELDPGYGLNLVRDEA